MPETSEKLSQGEPTFFVRKKVFAMFANNHHNDGHIAVWIPAPGLQTMLIAASPETYFKPQYVGVRGWGGIELDSIGDAQWSGKDCHRKIACVDHHAVPQVDVASLEDRRGSAIRSAVLELDPDGGSAVLFRNHGARRWSDALLLDPP